jgi:hypothetical protein
MAAAQGRFRPAVEQLEDRRVPTVTYHGGAVLRNVGVEALFLGSDWSSDPALAGQAVQLGSFFQYLTNSSFMDALGSAGYRVGRGSYLDGPVDPVPLSGAASDAAIQGTLSASISDGLLQAPDANRLYVVFVAPDVNVTTSFGTSALDFYGYHSAFVGPTGAPVNYAVVAYPSGPNAPYPGLSPFETLTKVSAHELAESVTDPQGDGVGRTAWYDNTYRDPVSHQRGAEIADIEDGVILDLGGYVIQGFANRRDRLLIPGGAGLDPRFGLPRYARLPRHQTPRHRAGHHPPAGPVHHAGHHHGGHKHHPAPRAPGRP